MWKNGNAGLNTKMAWWSLVFVSEDIKAETYWLTFSRRVLKLIFLNENVWTCFKISFKFVPNGPITIQPALVQIMAWCRTGNKLLSQTKKTQILMHISTHQSDFTELKQSFAKCCLQTYSRITSVLLSVVIFIHSMNSILFCSSAMYVFDESVG